MEKISLDQPLARGRTADVFAWEDGQVLKLFHNWFSIDNIQYELKIARAVHASGVSAPAVIGEIIQFESRNGLIYERVAGKSMLEIWSHQPWKVFSFARRFAALHAQMHAHVFTADVSTQRSKLDQRIRHNAVLPAPLRTALLDRLNTLPDGEFICHGDFHPNNVLVTQHGDAVIDWIDSSRGNPLADVARTSIILLGAAQSTQLPTPFLKISVRIFHSIYLKHYFRLRKGGLDEYRRWQPIIAAARLSEGMPELEQWLLEQAQKV
jgi:Ser/Thr protein kinase RdoA (MazF antagonist)